MRRQLRTVAMAVSLFVALGTFTVAQDYDDYNRGGGNQARQYGYDNGFRDGQRRGQHEGRENDPYDYHTPDWRQATHGYKNWMGPIAAFQNGYQQGYVEGFRSGFNSERAGWRGDGDRDGDYRGNRFYGSDNRIAYNTGYQDGASVARDDMYKNKSFNPEPRGRYDDRDHGYRREYGDKNFYRSQYAEGYRAGYQSAFDRRY
jgi:hypothetical protein